MHSIPASLLQFVFLRSGTLHIEPQESKAFRQSTEIHNVEPRGRLHAMRISTLPLPLYIDGDSLKWVHFTGVPRKGL